MKKNEKKDGIKALFQPQQSKMADLMWSFSFVILFVIT